ncbi:hypothetical protein [Demequina soli]|uniref:hypothetical protein n=1 Tax=Demequina soli TaxID=1638987 RepID=UPI0007865DD2|nr:hypothetical protein [Demequina soli]
MTVDAEARLSAAAVAARCLVAAGALLALVGGLWGAGWFGGTPVGEAAGGALASDATLVAPAPQAFAIWGVIYGGIALFAVVQALPGHGSGPRIRAAAWPMLGAMVLNFAWISVIQHGWLLASVAVMAGLVACLGYAAVGLVRRRTASLLEAAALDLPVGLYLGWASVAAVANVTALGAWWLGSAPDAGMPAAVGVLIAATFLGIAMSRDLAPRPVLAWAMAGAVAWGLWWIGEGRLHGTPDDALVGWVARAGACIVLLTVLITTVAATIRSVREARRHRPPA